jgi:hypothetical protein
MATARPALTQEQARVDEQAAALKYPPNASSMGAPPSS